MLSCARWAVFRFCLVVLTGFLATPCWAWTLQPVVVPLDCADRMPSANFQVSTDYKVDNALLATLASYVVEKRSKELIEEQFTAWQFRDVLYLGQPRQGFYGIVAEMDDFRLVAFRGTTSFEEAIKDSLFNQVSYAPIGLAGAGHFGMRRHFEKLQGLVMQPLLERIEKDPKPLYLVGHSLGGAMALMYGMRLKLMGQEVAGIYTSGQPRVGNEDFYNQARELVGSRYFRLEHVNDITPRVPPSRDVAAIFARVIPWDVPPLQAQLEGLVKRLNYHRPDGFLMLLNDESPPPDESAVGLDEIFWASLDGALQGARSIHDVSMRLSERLVEHPGMRYVCNLVDAMRGGGLNN
ncbi:MAG: lipase family protein [Deltaproteobacteria bacterium]|nr:lipase family protein [Deltaproteobacteria bacterium]